MKKLYSLIKACMTNDMQIVKISSKKGSKKTTLIPIFIVLYLMFMIWGSANSMFEKLESTHLEYLLLSIAAFGISIMTIMEGIYKTGPLIFNCKDDQLLLSLPLKRRTVLFIRIFKFYIFELVFNSMFLLPVMIAYIRWAENLTWTYYLTSIIMLLLLPVIPIVISCIIGMITSSLSSRFKYKNLVQIVISMAFILGIIYFSYNMDGLYEYIIQNATSINDMITKLYYPAGIYATLVSEFNIKDLLIFIIFNISILIVSIYVLSKFYFKINSRLKAVTTTKKTKIKKESIKARPITISLVKKELETFFKTPVFIINAGFALVLFVIATIFIALKFDSVLVLLTSETEGLNISKNLIMNNIPIFILILISFTAFMTSITNSVISLEGRKINILKSLPIKTKTILMSKIYSSLVLTTPILFIGDIILFIKFKISILESLLLLLLSVLIPLISHFIGLIVNLKYPKLDAENSAEVVKQSASSLISVTIGMILLIATVIIISNIIGKISSLLILAITTIIYLIIDIILYVYIIKKSVKEFDALTI